MTEVNGSRFFMKTPLQWVVQAPSTPQISLQQAWQPLAGLAGHCSQQQQPDNGCTSVSYRTETRYSPRTGQQFQVQVYVE